MQILFLGTSAGWPLPRLNCRCQICSSKNPKDKRLRPSVLINKKILIDAGPDFYHQFQKYAESLRQFSYLFISHLHPDHYFGLWDVAKIYQKNKITIFLSEKNQKDLLKRINDLSIKFLLQSAKTFKKEEVIKLTTTCSITPFAVDHSQNTETFGFLVKEVSTGASRSCRSRSGNLVYIPDFRSLPTKSLKYLRKIKLAIFDGSTFEPAGPDRFGHLPIKETIKLAQKLKIDQVYFTHIGHGLHLQPHRLLEKKLKMAGGKNFHLAYDGLNLKV